MRSGLYLFSSLWLHTNGNHYCSAFSVDIGISQRRPVVGPLHARPSPKLDFDLDAIEAFEKQLETQEQQLAGHTKDSEESSDNDKSSIDTTQRFIIPESLHNKRIDAALAELMEPPLSRSVCGTLALDGCVKQILAQD